MTRIEWTRYEGNDVEAVVAMFINRERPRSTRITPSVGDGGIDILERDVDGTGLDVVYQVKSYAVPLTSGQKTEVEKSLRRLKGPDSDDGKVKKDPRWKDLHVDEWHLVTPWDPSPEAENWLHDLGKDFGVTAIWDGLATVDQYAAKYADVVDCYLHGGRGKIEQAYQQVAAIFAADSLPDGLDVPTVNRRVQKALQTLDHDPHYRYEHRFGRDALPAAGGRPNLVMSFVTGDRASGDWVIVDVIARCAVSTDERPITIDGELTLKSESDAAAAHQDMVSYGTPFTSPAGAFNGEIDAPGGLGGPLKDATIRISGVLNDLGDNPEIYVEMMNPAGEVLAAVNLNRVERSQGVDGVRVVLEEENRVFILEDRYKLADRSGSRKLSFGDVIGLPVAAVAKALDFVLHCHAPNVGRMSVRHTPPAKGITDKNFGLLDDETVRDHIQRMYKIATLLARLQTHSSSIITFPDLDTETVGQLNYWRFAAALFDGQMPTATYPDGQDIIVETPGIELTDGDIVIGTPFSVMVGHQRVELGKVFIEIENAEVLRKVEVDGRTFWTVANPDRRIRYCLAPDENAEADESSTDEPAASEQERSADPEQG
ncbi:hypothetical protein [Kribbella monticola]|uniref:hypothetical protein n=1 Tax=Kribbella monticola TaxID=2185285 RepID=UPI000DD453D5|nr:hypothetical protein [Kribbella monticola]